MIDRLRTPPMMVGLVLAALLLLAVVGIAKEMGGADVTGSVQNNVGAAVVRPMPPQHTIPAIGDVHVDNFGYRFVWLGRAWFSCRHLDPVTLVYDTNNVDLAITDWSRLTTDEKRGIAEVCYAE